MKEIIDGNIACSKIAYLFSEIASIYPITPSSPMASNIDHLSVSNHYNLFLDKVKVVEMQSEAGAIAAMHGALLTGSLATTFTSSQGLLLMIPNMYKIAGECLPGVIHVAARTVATHALSIFGDHSDVYGTRQTGFCMLASNNPTECYHMAIIAHLSAIKGSLPFLHFFDGFRTSHEINVVETLQEKDLIKLVDKESLKKFKDNALNVGKKIERGMSETEDIYFQSVEAREPLYKEMEDIVNDYMEKINHLANTSYKPFMYYGDEEAESIIIAMGSVCDTIKLVVKEERKKGHKIGMIEVHLYRPFSKKYLENVLPKTTKKIAVLDRTKESGSIGEPLYLDVLSALKDKNIEIVGGRYGLSSKNTTPSQIKAVFDMLKENRKDNFTIGITDDVNNTSLEIKEYKINLNTYEIQIFGFGSDGMVSASKDILKILGKKNYVQGYFSYDSKKSGGVTVSNLRIGREKINAPYYVTNVSLVVVTKEEYFTKYQMLKDVKENAKLLINTVNIEKCLEKLTNDDLEIIKRKNICIMAINGEEIAMKNHIPGKISKIMEAVILNILGIENTIELLNNSIENQFRTKGQEVVTNNQNAIKEAINATTIVKIIPNKKEKEEIKNLNIYEKMLCKRGDELTVKEIENLKTGVFEGGLSKKEKRGISTMVSKWIKENCIECGMCSFVCPHAVIRPFLIENKEEKKWDYIIKISEKDCTGCGLCVEVCPGKNKNKALMMGKLNEKEDEELDKLFNHYENPKIFPKFTIKGSQLERPKFEFSGACAGCGETAYIKLLTQLFKDEIIIANATGCSSIYGGSAPSTPYSISWANSLFEDNAEFALGMHLSYKNKREQIKKMIKERKEPVETEVEYLYDELLNHFEDFETTNQIKEKLKEHEIPSDLKELLDYIPKRTVFAIGGDGWAYDIGYGGLDHVLSQQENIKVLVLDSEVYSNTGGQMSKSSRIGAVAEFADLGKRTPKKDLFKKAMTIPNCYVASISLGANMMQTIRAMKEAKEHNGPSIIIAYSTCIEQGIKGGMTCSLKEQKEAVSVGYNLLMRYIPEEDKLIIDQQEPNFEKYIEFLKQETRYKALEIKNKTLAEELLMQNKLNAIKRYNYYKKIEEKK